MRVGLLLGLVLVAILMGTSSAATVFGFNSPYSAAISPTQNYVYVTNSGNNTVSIVNSMNDMIIGTITGFDIPTGIAITPNGTFLYVANFGDNELAKVSTATGMIIDFTGGFNQPEYVSLSPDGKTAYVTNQGNGQVSAVALAPRPLPTIAPINPAYDLGQPITLTASWAASSPPYTANWIIEQGSSPVFNAQYSGITGLNSILSLSSTTLGVGDFAANVIVEDGSSVMTSSAEDAFAISSILNPANPVPYDPVITSGQSVTLTANPNGGSGSYSYTWYVSLTSPCSSSWIEVGTGPSITVVPAANLYYCYVVTDSATTPVSGTSGSDLVTVNQGSSTTTSSTGSTGSGPGGGGGGGVQKPIIMEAISNSTSTLVNLLGEKTGLNITSSVPSQNEDIILNIASLNTFNVTLHGERLNFTTNFISPTSAGMTINNQEYVFSQNTTFLIKQKNYNYTLSVELFNISILPILNTVELAVSSEPNPINITAQNFTMAILSNQTLSVQNLTSSRFVPSIPTGYYKQLVQNVSVRQIPGTPNPRINTTVGVAIKYNCSIPSYDEIPLILSNYSWAQVSSFTVRPNDCVVTFSFHSDPVMALTRYVGPSNKTKPPTTTIPYCPVESQAGCIAIPANSLSHTSTTSIPYQQSNHKINVPPLALYSLGAVAAAVIAWIAYRRYRLRPRKPKEGARSKVSGAKPQEEGPRAGKKAKRGKSSKAGQSDRLKSISDELEE